MFWIYAKKLFLVLIMIVSSLFAKPLNGDIDFTNDNVIQNNVTEKILFSFPSQNSGGKK